MYWVEDVVRKLGIENLYVIGDDWDDDNCDLVLIFFKDDGLGLLFIIFYLRDDLVILLFLSGVGGFFRGVMLIYYNLVVLGCIVSMDGFLDLKEKVFE